ncbi:tRNA A64-2'-O-ribosylphosphate transferase [Lasiodiplodia theobromae]|uniref:tRNA A64-2'-O-ribosylphosphate transferase n=1 Tax=Lasiodiplodia theobromae TaxID=45133 RepID=A0A5N5D738_9PEZI|nr:tRNA A64-2'-O-ribosylphosphate transferase [Lasiodiplodia theobromae]
MSRPIQTSDIIFPELSTDFSTTLSSLKRATLSISNRLRSISEDAEFVCAVADAYRRPLVANERCGSWYIPLERKAASAYFKSTDGHTGEWSFSLRRLNIQVLEVVGANDGCIIVDSTRRGMPDALSKTVPIWCAIWNALLFPSSSPDPSDPIPIHLPPTTVSASERAQITSRLPTFLAAARALNLPLDRLRAQLKKPLRPLWVTRDSPLPGDDEGAAEGTEGTEGTEGGAGGEGAGVIPSFPDFHPVILCTASRRVPGGEVSEGGYVQGAGDDSEGWARGLTAPLFWGERRDELLRASEAELPELIAELVKEASFSFAGASAGGSVDAVQLAPAGWVWVCAAGALRGREDAGQQFDAVVECGDAPPDEALAKGLKGRYLHLKCGTGKLGSRDLRNEIAKIEEFVLRRVPEGGARKLAICCQTGKDLSVGVALAVLCLYADEEGQRLTNPNDAITKDFIRQRLSWIMTAYPAASPSRATLQSVNAFLFSPREKFPLHSPPLPLTPAAAAAAPPPSSTEKQMTPLSKTFASLTTTTANPWTLARTLTSHLPPSSGGTPSGSFAGTATFAPRAPTAPGYAAECLYAEEGVLRTETGLEVAARRRYVWRYREGRMEKKEAGKEEEGEQEEGISIWFVKEDGESVDYLFLDMEFQGGEGGGKKLRAKGRHPCGRDMYDAEFVFGGGGEQGMVVTYVVKGPKKDYISETRYTR